MRGDAEGGGDDNDGEGEQQAVQQIFFLTDFGVHFAAPFIAGSKSQKTKPSRWTISPVRTEMGQRKTGPSKTNVWNSPFSPQGSAPGGRSRKKESSSSRPTKLGARTLGSMQAAMARKRCSWKKRMSSRVSRFQMGKRAVMPMRARLFSRQARRSSRKMSPNATLRTP